MGHLSVGVSAIFCGLQGAVLMNSAVQAQTSGTETPYEVSDSCSSASSSCEIDFAPAPKGTRLEVTNVTCKYQLGPSGARLRPTELYVIGSKGLILNTQFLTATFESSDSNFSYSATTASLFAFAKHPHKLALFVSGTGSQTFAQCSLSGHMVTL